MKTPVVAIGLDAADPVLVEEWMDEGHLPNLSALCKEGAYGRLTNLDAYKAETPWTTFLSGCMPETSGYWSPVTYRDGTYDLEYIAAYDFKEYPPFYALGDEFRVAVLDIPQTALSADVNGPQVLAWGAHSPQTESHSLPESLLDEIRSKYGDHPALHNDHGYWFDGAYLHRVFNQLMTGIERRTDIACDWLRDNEWDFFMTVYGEPHSAGHDFWHLSRPDHPLYGKGPEFDCDPMLEVFKKTDQAIGRLREVVPEQTNFIVFSVHGSDNNVTDTTSMVILPELMYRYSFPGKQKMAVGDLSEPVPDQVLEGWHGQWEPWENEVWNYRVEENPVHHFLRKKLPRRLHKALGKVFTEKQPLRSTAEGMADGVPAPWQPTMWYRPMWKDMKAFATPSFSDGYVRINLKGREPEGIVEPEDYDKVCDEVTQILMDLRNPRDGTPLVKKVVRTRTSPNDTSPKHAPADLVVVWSKHPADVADHAELGRIGPVPYRRTGSHQHRGFWVVRGPDVAPGTTLEEGHAVDLPPTILEMLGAPVPDHLDGKPMHVATRTKPAI